METTPTLADLIHTAVSAKIDANEVWQEYENGELERAQLALNALEERLAEMIETKVTQMLTEGVTRP